MRAVPSALADRIGSGAAALCHVWLLTRRDGMRLGFTDHDGPLTVDGVVCSAASGWTAGAAEAGLGLAPGSAAAAGVLDAAAVTTEDVAAGLYDGAEVGCWRVDWTEPALRVRLWTGRIERLVEDGRGGFTAEVEGPLAALKRVVGRLYGRTCDAALGDARCGVELAGAPTAVCDKRWETCVGVFGNGVNFQGFPFIPGDDFLAAYPAEGERADGSSRRA